MRILFDQGVYDMRNKGNVALLQIAVSRVRKLWPEASVEILTSAPHLLRLYCPEASPVSPDSQYDWTENRSNLNAIIRRIPRSLLRSLFEARDFLRVRWPALSQSLNWTASRAEHPLEVPESQVGSSLSSQACSEKAPSRGIALEAVQRSDLFIATGAQYMSDACRDDALRVLDRLEAAHMRGIPTAMVGQGIGPIDDAELRSRASVVLPHVRFIFVRDRLVAPPLLTSLGVDPARITFTGDDAIELGFESRRNKSGNAMGISLRLAHYTELRASDAAKIRPVIHDAANKHGARLIGIPISHSNHEMDDQVLNSLLGGSVKYELSQRRFDSPLELVKRVSRCRIVITGCFHTAVFALSQGIPAVGFAKSTMYVEKFKSLVDQFGAGCQVVDSGSAHSELDLAEAIDFAWDYAEKERSTLLSAASYHVGLGRAAYERLHQQVERIRQEYLFDSQRQKWLIKSPA